MITLGIETSCDETACAVVKDGKILSNEVSSSVKLHSEYGGVVPEIASRFHVEYINGVVKKALKKARVNILDLELIAVTYGPGLSGSLLIGVSFAKALSYALSIPIIGINHINAHIYANFIRNKFKRMPKFPFIGLVVSGGHTSIMLCRNLNDFRILGNTKDDAVGEAFDKVAKILGLGYPGGPIIEKRARHFRKKDMIKLPKTYLEKHSYDFSFSGIKTAVLYYIKNKKLTKDFIALVAYSFQEAVFDVIIEKTIRACRKFDIKTLVIGGGVAANNRLFNKIKDACDANRILFYSPGKSLCLDNGAMVAMLGEALFEKNEILNNEINVETNLESMLTWERTFR